MSDDQNEDRSTTILVTVWDRPTRLFHWLLVGLIIFSWWSAENHHLEWHKYSGYTILGLLLFRMYWGVFGSSTARFKSFVKPWRDFSNYASNLFQRPPSPSYGHNPMGGWSVIAMLAALSCQTITGLFSVDVDGLNSGPLSYLVSFDIGRLLAQVHELSFNILLVLVGLHILTIFLYEFVRGERLIMPMLNGRKMFSSKQTLPDPFFAGPLRAVLGIVTCAAIIFALANGLRF